MVRYKRILVAVLSASLILGMTGCGKKENNVTEIEDETTTEEVIDVIDTEKETTEDYSDVDLNSPEALDEQEKFDDWLWDSFVESVNADSITLNYSLANPEEYDITPTVATYGDADMSEEALEEEKQDSIDTLDELKDFDYSLFTD